ncbi:MAG TPA: malate/lactate/ureidoglycolate dehydrogenase [Burkholderiales bacterium]|nr:malate/lactate/ureidoglycolate dehydrogenase [Burkholderiales bacterium]
MDGDVLLPTDAMRAWVRDLWLAAGCEADEAQRVAEHLVGANLAGHDSHGVAMVLPYVRSLKADELQLNREITVVTDTGTLLVVDGNRGIGQSMAHQTMELAIERARKNGIAMIGLRNTHHIGRVGHWAEEAIAAGLASIHFTNVVSRPLVSPHGGGQSRFGTNPLTVGLPRKDGPPILLDFATSAIAVGKVRVAYNRKAQAPVGALIDHQGKATTNPAVMYEEPLGALLTAAGHKGYALAMVCDLLGAAIFGGTTPEPSRLRPPGLYNNMLAIVFDPSRFGAAEHYEREAREFIDYVQSARRTDPNAPIEIPGDAERRYRRERAQALPVDPGTLRTLDEAAKAINELRGSSLAPASSLAAR